MTRPSARGPRTIAALVSVTAIEDLSPTFRRVRLAGPDLLEASPGLIGDGPEITCSDAYLKLVIPPPGGEPQRPDLEAGLPAWFALPVEQRGWLRTYTARSCRWIDHDGRRVPEIAVDVALHAADEGPGGRGRRGHGGPAAVVPRRRRDRSGQAHRRSRPRRLCRSRRG